MMDKITVASVNCRGLGNVQKRRDVFHYLRQKHYSIYFLQDTHLDPKLDKYITAEWGLTSSFFLSFFPFFFPPIIQDLEVWPYFLIMILNSRSRGYLGTMEEIY